MISVIIGCWDFFGFVYEKIKMGIEEKPVEEEEHDVRAAASQGTVSVSVPVPVQQVVSIFFLMSLSSVLRSII